METRAVPLPQPNGPLALLAVTRDITHRRHLESKSRSRDRRSPMPTSASLLS